MIALTAAMQPEIELIKNSITNAESIKWKNWEFLVGDLYGQQIVAVRTGVGKVLAALITQRLIDQFKPEAVIMSGIGGSINPAIHKGDLVVGIDSLQHDMDATKFGFKRGQIPYTEYHIIPSDPELINIALSYSKEPLKSGRILTGDQFFTGSGDSEYDYMRNELHGDIVEMEGAAAGLTAMINEVPFLIIRAVSDDADGGSGKNYKRFIKRASERNFELIKYILKKIN